MSEKSELQQRAEDVLLDLVNKAAEIGSAAVDEIPLVVQELLTWKAAESLLLCLGAVTLWLAAYILGRKTLTHIDDIQDGIIPIGFILLMVSVGAFFMFSLDWLQIWLAPRVYLLEYAANLVK